MTQNTSHAVMAQRAEPNNSLDFFPTPPWATRALFEHVIQANGLNIWEPACGDGSMYRPICEYAEKAWASDVHDYGWGHEVHDFLQPYCLGIGGTVDWIITNPPFRLAEQFVQRAREVAHVGVAILVRSVFIESSGRFTRLYSETPPVIMAQFVERVPMVKGRLDRLASTATSYCWLIWPCGINPHEVETRLRWIPPCRKQLERATDYPEAMA